MTTALLAAFTCAATFAIRIPTPGTVGYIHPGDALVILSGAVLGPWYGLLAAAIGSAFADLLGGYLLYVPATLILKGLIACITGFSYRKFGHQKKVHELPILLGGMADLCLVAGGYFLYELILYQSAAALVNIPANLVQSIGGWILAMLLYPVLFAIPDVRRIANEV